MDDNNGINAITTQKCPHCGGEVIISLTQQPASINSLYKKEQIQDAKKELIEKLDGVNIDKKSRDEIYNWINSESTFVVPEDVVKVLNNILNSIKNENKTQGNI